MLPTYLPNRDCAGPSATTSSATDSAVLPQPDPLANTTGPSTEGNH